MRDNCLDGCFTSITEKKDICVRMSTVFSPYKCYPFKYEVCVREKADIQWQHCGQHTADPCYWYKAMTQALSSSVYGQNEIFRLWTTTNRPPNIKAAYSYRELVKWTHLNALMPPALLLKTGFYSVLLAHKANSALSSTPF